MKIKSNKVIKWVAIVAGIAFIAIIASFFLNKNANKQGEVYVVSVSEVSGNTMINGINNRYTGVIEPQSTKEIKLSEEKKLGEIFVKEGDQVKAGDKLFSYDIGDMTLELEQKKVDLASLNSQINDKTQEINNLYNEKANASGDMQLEMSISIQQAETELKSLKFDVQSKQLEIDEKTREIENADVTSPIDGTIKAINNPNDASSSSFGDSSAFMTIVAEGNFLVKGKISELNVHEITIGEEMLIRSRVDENKTWKALISSIETGNTSKEENSGFAEEGQEKASKYNFYLSLENTDGLMIGQHVTIEKGDTDTQAYQGILLASFYINDIEENPTIWVSKNGKLKKVSVTLGKYREASDEYEVLKGLEMDDYIAFPSESLKEGQTTTTQMVEEEMPMEEMPIEEGMEEEVPAEVEESIEEVPSEEGGENE